MEFTPRNHTEIHGVFPVQPAGSWRSRHLEGRSRPNCGRPPPRPGTAGNGVAPVRQRQGLGKSERMGWKPLKIPTKGILKYWKSIKSMKKTTQERIGNQEEVDSKPPKMGWHTSKTIGVYPINIVLEYNENMGRSIRGITNRKWWNMDMGHMFTKWSISWKHEQSHFLRWLPVSFVLCRRNSYGWSSVACRRDFQEKPPADTLTSVYLWVYDMYDMDDYWVANCFDCQQDMSQEPKNPSWYAVELYLGRSNRYSSLDCFFRENSIRNPLFVSWGKAWCPVSIFPSTNPMIFLTSWWHVSGLCYGCSFHCACFRWPRSSSPYLWTISRGSGHPGWWEATGWTLGWKITWWDSYTNHFPVFGGKIPIVDQFFPFLPMFL